MPKRPDAIMIPESYKGTGINQHQRINTLIDATDKLLEVDPTKGETSYVRRQPGGSCFVTRDPHDTIRHPSMHPKSKQPRYRWEPHPTLQGVEVGYLIEDTDAVSQ